MDSNNSINKKKPDEMSDYDIKQSQFNKEIFEKLDLSDIN
jgi:hypothetical protein